MDCQHKTVAAIVALRNEKGSYNLLGKYTVSIRIVALRNEKGSYNVEGCSESVCHIVALRNEKGSYNNFAP